MLRPKLTAPRHRNSHRADAEKRAPAFLQWLRGRECLIGGTCSGKIEAAHVDYAPDKGMGTKPSDKYAVPLCATHHCEQHNAGIRTFEHRHNVNMLARAADYWRYWPGRAAWEKRNG